MQTTDRYSLQALPKWHLRAAYRRRLLADGQPTPTLVNGDDISLQMAVGSTTLLATNYDYFDGVSHWIYLVGPEGMVMDSLSMPDVFGFMQDVSVASDLEISFSYFGTNDRWTLRVDNPGFRSWVPSALRARLNRFLLSKRHLRLRRVKGPPWQSPR
jgi:hypothetical protein